MKFPIFVALLLSSFEGSSGFVSHHSFGVRSSALHSSIGMEAPQGWTAPQRTIARKPNNKARTHNNKKTNKTKNNAKVNNNDTLKIMQEVLEFDVRDADLIFSIIDVDGNNALSKEELSTHLIKAGYPETTVSQIFQKMDVNKDGEISRDEFGKGMMQLKALQTAPGLGNFNSQYVKEILEDADQVFQTMDADNNGSIDAFEIQSHMGRRWLSYSDEAIASIFQMLDVNGDERISKEEFRNAFLRHSALRQVLGEGPNFK